MNNDLQLTSPLPLGISTAPARLLFGPHVTNLGRKRAFTKRHTHYYTRRARGGAGIIVTETASVHSSDYPYERAPLAELCEDGWRDIAGAINEWGTLAVASLGHAGAQGSSAYSQKPLWAPSPVPQNNDREVPKEMEPADIDELVAGFGGAARLAVAAGMNGVEVNAGQFSLVRQFLSGLTNHRVDEYGTDKLRLVREVIDACRSATGTGLVGLRLSCDELAPWAGITLEQASAIVGTLAESVDYLVVERGSIYSVSATRPDGHVPPGFNLDLVTAMYKAAAGHTTVIGQGSIVDTEMADDAIASGICDAVEMTRALIADADLIDKIRGGEPERVRPCLLCNQRCMVRDARNPIVSCTVDPATGWEGIDDPQPKSVVGKVLIVGGGVAGLEAARIAAPLGGEVTVRERNRVLGGAALTVSGLPGMDRVGMFIEWLERECARAGVAIHVNSEVDAAEVAAFHGAVLLCTGSRPSPSELPEGTLPVFDGREVLDALNHDRPLADGPVVVWDPLGGPLGIGLAELLAADRSVTLVTPDLVAAKELALTGDLAPGNTRLQQAGVAIIKTATIVGLQHRQALVENRYTGERQVVDAAFVVDARHREPELSVWDETGRRHRRVGDALAPRTIYEALVEARRAVSSLGGERQ